LAHVRRAQTEIQESSRQRWLARMLQKRSTRAQRAYKTVSEWKQDPAVAAVSRSLASCYYQLKTGHAAIGAHLYCIKAKDSEACKCRASSETIHHLLFKCRQWRGPRRELYRALMKAGLQEPSMAEECPEGRLLDSSKATGPLLQFLAATAAGCTENETAQAAINA
jgi:hypothetical protein